MLSTLIASADVININNIYYNLDFSTKTAEVTSNPDKYSGSVYIPASVTFKGSEYSVTSIGEYAFEYCSGLTSITIPNSVTSIGNSAFSGCSGLTKVTLNSNVLASKMYSYDSTLGGIFGSQVKEFILGNEVTSIGSCAFYYCKSLTSVTIPNSVTSIGYDAFCDCSGLNSVTIGNSVTRIGGGAFRGCSGLTSISVENGNEEYDSRDNCNAIIETASNTLIAGCKNTTIPNSVTSIGSYAFYGCSGLASVTIPNSVTSIGSSAFMNCTGLTSVHITDIAAWCRLSFSDSSSNPLSYAGHLFMDGKEIIDLVIPNSVKSVGERAFIGCSGLTSVTIPNSVTSIGSLAFSGCSGLTSVTIPNSVTSIGDYAFRNCSGLTSITIPNSVTSIGNYAFRNCSSLTSVTIPNSVTSIGSSAFRGCSGLTSVTIPNSVTSIEDYAFSGCFGLTSITIPNSVTSIGGSAFRDCSGLTSITIPNSVTSIRRGAFYGCSGLTSVKSDISIPFTFGSNAFSNISSNCVLAVPYGTKDAYISNGWTTSVFKGGIKEIMPIVDGIYYDFNSNNKQATVTAGENKYSGNVIIPSSVTFNGTEYSVTCIGDSAFYSCDGLTSVTIPNSVTSIGNAAFANCIELAEVYCYAKQIPTTGNDVFKDSYINYVTLHVPASAVNAYKTTAPWREFGSIVALPEPTLRGDANGDGKVDMDDATFVTNIILGTEDATEAADVNKDGEINMPDVMFIINYIKNGKFPDE